MLILVRKPRQSVILHTQDGPVRVIVFKLERDRVSLGIDAPESVVVRREEIDDRAS